MNEEKYCLVCGNPNVHHHEVFFGNKCRKISIKYGFQEYLCFDHHNNGKDSVHQNRAFDLELKMKHQRIFQETHSEKEFLSLIGRNYL